MRWILALILVAAATGATAQTFEQNELDKEHVAALRKAIEANLKDPYSVVYTLPALKDKISQRASYCGCYNAKNGFGAYTGRDIIFGTFEQTPNGLTFKYFPPTVAGEREVDRKACTIQQYQLPC